MVITLEGIRDEPLRVYIQTCYANSFTSGRDLRIEPSDDRSFYSISELIALWQLCDRFTHQGLKKMTELAIKRTITTMGRALAKPQPGSIQLFADGFLLLRANPRVGGEPKWEYGVHVARETLSAYLINVFCKYCQSLGWAGTVKTLPREFVAEVSVRWHLEIMRWRRGAIERHGKGMDVDEVE